MSTRKSVKEAAGALRRHSRRVADYHYGDRHPQYATVLSTEPWEVELHSGRIVLTEEDLTITQWVEKYDFDHVVEDGDTVLVHEMSNGDWVVTDVVSPKSVSS